MSILDERKEYLNNPFFEKHEYGDFTPFYITITICSVIGGFLFILNVAFCWCSRHREYWQDRHTGNRWIQSMWTVTPHKNPPLDLSELESGIATFSQTHHEVVQYQQPESQPGTPQPREYMELQKRESEI
ncbi:uncharacterized protein LOC105702279 [Orussus abietinus]|uniref:uncharacterized protein LOC105702279 n=1 Tax=Orussus abietinus TaxID=222816 RepID=UPI000626AC22|nr:uncharacterized protein LOC105702279 [Orussus abietinus]XP_012285166.1 uncharacterized protein LOC105702279 [Orussus abietinus]